MEDIAAVLFINAYVCKFMSSSIYLPASLRISTDVRDTEYRWIDWVANDIRHLFSLILQCVQWEWNVISFGQLTSVFCRCCLSQMLMRAKLKVQFKGIILLIKSLSYFQVYNKIEHLEIIFIYCKLTMLLIKWLGSL